MATEEILRTNTTPIAATTNPQANMEAIQPVTIPLKIQPMITQQPAQQTVQQTVQQQNNQQAAAQVVQPTTTAPVPVAAPQQPNNYNYNFNNYTPKNAEVKQFNPIVLDNTSYPNTEYKSQYAGAVNQLANQILNMRFSYNPNEDDLLQQAAKYTTQNTFESMNNKGILNSSLTAERVARVVGELIPTYEKMARDEFESNFNMLMNTAQLIMNLDDSQYRRWQADRELAWEKEQVEYKKAQDALKNAWERVDELGYVDNAASIVLGVPVGTLSKSAREAMEERQYELETWYRKQEAQQRAEKELLLLKADLEREEMLYNSQLSREEALLKAQLAREQAAYDAQLDKESALLKYQLSNSGNLGTLDNTYSSNNTYGTNSQTTSSNNSRNLGVELGLAAAKITKDALAKADNSKAQVTMPEGSNTLRVTNNGKTYELMITPGMSRNQILQWGERIGVSLQNYV